MTQCGASLKHSAPMAPMGGKQHSNESIVDDVISSEPTSCQTDDLLSLKNQLDDISTRVNTLEIMIMRVLDALELSHNVNTFVNKEKKYYGP